MIAKEGGEMIAGISVRADAAVDVSQRIRKGRDGLKLLATDDRLKGVLPGQTFRESKAESKVAACPECSVGRDKRKNVVTAGVVENMVINRSPLRHIGKSASQSKAVVSEAVVFGSQFVRVHDSAPSTSVSSCCQPT